ncbi:MAG TPA: GNAT family N-acetyltransferase [Longimicrobiales bacterium]
MSRYLLRAWRSSDAAEFRAAVDETLPDLTRWLNWAHHEPATLAETGRRLAEYESDFRLGLRWRYAIVDAQTASILGGASIHQRIGVGGRDLGYWLRTSARGRGIMTATVHELTRHAFEADDVERVEIHCDHGNDRSSAVPLRLGFKVVGEFLRTRPTGEQRVATIYRLEQPEFPTPRMLLLRGLPAIALEP